MLNFFDFLLIICTLGILAYGTWRRVRLWRLGKSIDRSDNPNERWLSLIRFGIAQTKILKENYPGVMHLLIFWGFLLPLLVAFLVALGLMPSLPKPLSLLLSIILDVCGLAAIAGVLLAIYRRYVRRPERLDNIPQDFIGLILILAIIVSGFFVEALRMATTSTSWTMASPVGSSLALPFLLTGSGANVILYGIFRRIHLFCVLGFFAYLPFSTLFHIITTPLNIYFRSHDPKGALPSIPPEEFETAESFGVSQIDQFTWKDLLDLDACTRCGRCQDSCPAFLSGKPLSPKKIIQDLKRCLEEKAPQLLAKNQTSGGAQQGGQGEAEENPIPGEYIHDDEIWACTTCRNCLEHCPVFIEQMNKIIDMRRYLVMMEARFPAEITTVFKNFEVNSNPWGMGLTTRGDWCKELGVKALAEDSDVEWLYYVGCAGSFDDRSKRVATAFVRLLQKAGVNFGILGQEEGCCGDSARRSGNEYLFQIMTQKNIEVFNAYQVKKIVTTCPHGYNTIKNEYPQFGGSYEVKHHSELIAQLLAEGKLVLNGKPEERAVVYHDSCYLGRYNDVFDPPREIISKIPGSILKEMERNRDRGFCCGAGGARMWMEEHQGSRINEMRTEQALELEPSVICTACPFCLTMIEDGIKAKEMEQPTPVLDIAEIVEKMISKPEPK